MCIYIALSIYMTFFNDYLYIFKDIFHDFYEANQSMACAAFKYYIDLSCFLLK